MGSGLGSSVWEGLLIDTDLYPAAGTVENAAGAGAGETKKPSGADAVVSVASISESLVMGVESLLTRPRRSEIMSVAI